ncbi:hypothetical protein OUZ56_032934 [Daphnia magna]|uniref:MADF domain-containing protein n=1 Tax=Daphnia magna TaxID=35525 RepID=A0ABQ9ZX95_9CRUS|nr:hypothetical protein OUZ56_032934 [Daphnia magna]
MSPPGVNKQSPSKNFNSPKKKSPKKRNKSSRKWCEEERELLIEAVKKYPCLHDTNSKSYKDITVKTNAKLEISHLFENCTVEDVTTQWTQLVDKFRRVRKVSNIEDPTGTSTEDSRHQLPQWDLYHTLSFLDEHIKQRARFTNLSSAKVLHIDLVQERGVDQMENEEIGNTDKDNVLYLNDVSFVSVNDTQSITLDNESLVNSEDSLPISDTMNRSCTKNVLTAKKKLDSISLSQSQKAGKPTTIIDSKTSTESRPQAFPKTSTPTPSTSSSDALSSYPDSRIKRNGN